MLLNILTFTIVSGKYVYYSFYADDGRAYGSTGLKCTMREWHSTRPKHVTARMAQLEVATARLVLERREALRPVLAGDIKDLVAIETGRVVKKDIVKELSFIECFDKYLEGAMDGEILNKGKKASAAMIHILNFARKYLVKWKGCKKPINSMSLPEFLSLQALLVSAGLSHNSLSTYFNRVLIMCRKTHELGWHTNAIFKENGMYITGEDVDYPIYFNKEEISRISALRLTESLAVVRDWFIVGCNCGLRYSDLCRIKPSMVNGRFIVLRQQKTRRSVMFPVNAEAKEILEKYNYTFTYKENKSTFNYRIKKIAKQAGIKQLCPWNRTQGGVQVEKEVEKHRLASTHTMRRSFATNAYLAGVDPLIIMSITGHRTLKSFMRYIRLTIEEKAVKAAEHPFFA